jgi:hypothetical protein
MASDRFDHGSDAPAFGVDSPNAAPANLEEETGMTIASDLLQRIDRR